MKLEAVNESHVVITFISEVNKVNLNEFTIRAKIYAITRPVCFWMRLKRVLKSRIQSTRLC